MDGATQFPGTKSALPAPLGRTAVLSLAAFAAGLVVVWLIEAGSEEAYSGRYGVQMLPVVAEQGGVVREVISAEGRQLKPGDPLLVIHDEQRESRLAEQRREVARLQSEVDRLAAQADVDLAWRMKDLRQQMLEARLRAAELLKAEYDRKVEQHAWRQFLSGERPIEEVRLPDDVFATAITDPAICQEQRVRILLRDEAARNAAEVSAAQIALCEERLEELELLQAELPGQVARAIGLEAAKARLENAKNELAQLEEIPAEHTLASPGYGALDSCRARPGIRLAAGETFARLLDDEQQYVDALVPPEKLPELAPGKKVALRFPDGEKRSGRIERQDATARERSQRAGLVPVRILPAGRLWPEVPPGTAVEVLLDADA